MKVDDPPSLSNDWRWDLAKRISDAPQFRKSPRLREFLLFVCERTLQDRQAELREQQIGCAVFGRRPEYNTSEDNIVRVEARKLRMRLEEYFASEGRDEPILIDIPKGSYVPVFTPRTVVSEETAASTQKSAIADPRGEFWSWLHRDFWTQPGFWIQPAVILMLAVTCVWLWSRDGARRPPAADASTPARDVLWSTLFNDQHQTTIVCADSTLVLVQQLIRRPVSLEEYLSPSYRTLLSTLKAGDGTAVPLASKQYTSMADVHLVARFMQLNEPFWRTTSVRSARMMQLADFKTGNTILLGSKRAIPWVELFEAQMNFLFEFDETRRVPVIRNRSPQAGERSEYVNGQVGEPGDAFSFVALLPNLAYTGSVLVIAGSSMEATEAAGEFMSNPAFSASLMKKLGLQPKSKPRAFEVLLRSGTMAGTWKDSEIVCYRIGRIYETHP